MMKSLFLNPRIDIVEGICSTQINVRFFADESYIMVFNVLNKYFVFLFGCN